MIPNRIEGANHFLGAPAGWDDSQGRVTRLAVRRDGDIWMSSWEPTPEEVELIKAGGSVRLSVVGGQPPVMLDVLPPPSEEIAP